MCRSGEQRLGEPFLHGVEVWRQLGLLDNHRHIGVHELEAGFDHLEEGLVQQVDRVGVFPARIVVRKHAPNVA